MLYKGKTWQDSGILWNTLAYSGILWHTLAYSGILWHTLTYSGILWHTLAYSGIHWHTLAYSGILSHTLAYSGILWHALAYSGIINASLITADGAYHCPVGSIWPFLLTSSSAARHNNQVSKASVVKVKGQLGSFSIIDHSPR